MPINQSVLKEYLGKKYDPDADYIIEYPNTARAKINQGLAKLEGTIETEAEGSMIIVRRLPKIPPGKEPKEKGIKKWLNRL